MSYPSISQSPQSVNSYSVQQNTPQETNTKHVPPSPTEQKFASSILNEQNEKSIDAQNNPIDKTSTDTRAFEKAAQSLKKPEGSGGPEAPKTQKAPEAPKDSGADLIHQLESQIQQNPVLKNEAQALGQTVKILLNTCLTGTQEQKESALTQLKPQLAVLERKGVDKALISEISQMADGFQKGKVSNEMSEKELMGMVKTVIENSKQANSGEEFANRVQEQITGYRNASSNDVKDAHMQGLANSLATLKAEFASSSMIETLENVDRFAHVSSSDTIAPDLFAKVQGNNQHTEALTDLLGKFGNTESAITVLRTLEDTELFTLLDAVHNSATGDNKAQIELADRLDDAFMPHLEMHKDLAKVKEDAFAHLDTATKGQIEHKHQEHMACSIIVQALPDQHPLKSTANTAITHTDILDLITHNAELKLPDIALCNTYFLLGEGSADTTDTTGAADNANIIDNLANDLPKEWLGAALYKDLAQRGISSTQQLNESMAILDGSILSRRGKSAMISLITASRSDANAQTAEANIRRLATHLLGLDSGASIGTESLLAMCAKKFDLTLPQDTGIVEAYGVLTQKEGYLARVDTTFDTMTAKQACRPEQTKGETLAYSVLTMQRALVRDVTELSALDLSTLGAKPDDVKDAASLKHFVENAWQDTKKNDWATAILLKSYAAQEGHDPSITANHPALTANAYVFQDVNPQDIASLTLFAKSGVGAKVAQLDKGRTATSTLLGNTHSDEAGRLLKELGRRFCDIAGKTKIDSEVKVGDQSFTPSTASKDTLRKAMLAIVNGSAVNIGGEEQTYLCPVDCAHAALVNKHQKELRGINRIQQVQDKATVQQDATAISKRIQADFALTIGHADRTAFATGALLDDLMTTLNKNPNFESRLKPLALLDAQRQCNAKHVSNLFTPEYQARAEAALSQSLQTMGIGEKESALVAKGIMAEHKTRTLAGRAFDAVGEQILTAYALRSDAHRLAAAPKAVKSFIEVDRIEQNTLKVLEELPANTAFSMEHTASAKATVEGSLGAVELSASIKLGEQDGMTLWHSDDQDSGEKFGISISRGYLAGFEGNATAVEFLNLAASIEGDAKRGVVLKFDTKEDCAKFASRFLSNTAKREDITLASQVHTGSSYSIAGSISAGIGVEKELGVCSLALGANASVSGKVQYSKSVSGPALTTTSTATVTYGVSAGASASVDIVDDLLSVSRGIEASLEKTSTQTMIVSTSQDGKSLLSAESVVAISMHSGNAEGFTEFCASHGVPSTLATQIQAYLTENGLDGVTLEAHYTLNEEGRSAAMKGESIANVINTGTSYSLTHIDVVSSEDGRNRGFDLGFLQNKTTSEQTTTKSFAIA